jgi:hypothetical protein
MFNRLSASLFVGTLALAASGQAQPNSWELGHPDAKLMIGIDLKGLRESAAGQAVREQWKAQPQQIGPAALAMGFLEQVDSIFISSPALSPAVSKTAPRVTPGKAAVKPAVATSNNPPFLVVVEGSLPVEQLLAFLPGTSHRYHEVNIFRGAKATDASIAALDARTIVLGDEKSVLGAIDRRGHAPAVASPLLKRAEALASTHEVWVIAADSLSKFQPQSADGANPLASQMASKIKGVDMGLSVRDGLQFEMSLAAEDAKVAEQMSQLVSSQLSLALLAQANNPQAAEMAKRLHVDADGTSVRMSFALSAEEFAQQVKTAQATMMARAQASAAAPAQETRPQPVKMQPKPTTPGKVRIYGLDEGVKEIQLTH